MEKGTDCHAARLPGEYERSLKKYDVKYYGIDPRGEEVGPLVGRPKSYGKLKCLVFGSWRDCSQDVHHLIKMMGEARVMKMAI